MITQYHHTHKTGLRAFIPNLRALSEDGFSLIEVLVAVLVLAVGLLGFAALQLSAISSGEEGYSRSQAMIVAQSLADRMRANRDYINLDNRATRRAGAPVDNNVYGQTGGTLYGVLAGTAVNCPVPPVPFCSDDGATLATACNEQQLASFDVYQICVDAAAVLPGGRVATVCTDNNETAAAIATRPNPYQGTNHPVFDGTPAVLTGADNDNCSPGSRYSIFVGWRASAVQRNTGQVTQSLDSRCQTGPAANPPGPGFGAGIQCVAVELIP